MENTDKRPNEISRAPASPIVLFGLFLDSVGVTPPTGWRWRKLGWIKTLNIAGRVYVSREAVAEFERRAAAGEFAKEHVVPKRSRDQ